MYLLYLIALLPVIVGCFLFIFSKKVVFLEWLGSVVAALAVSGIMHGIAILGMTDDIETRSGKIINVQHHPAWTEQYTEIHTRTVGSGEDEHTEIYTTTEYDHHSEHWVASLNFGSRGSEEEISINLYNEIKLKFGNQVVKSGLQPTSHGGHFDGGDNNIYLTQNKTGYIYPVTCLTHFENRIKAAPTTFSFCKVPESVPVYEWPKNSDWMHSNRLLGNPQIDQREFDLMNSRLGPTKRVNVIIVKFNSSDSQLGHYQEAKWIGGKKNDLVICFGGVTNCSWVYCFGWTEKTIVKRNLESLLLGKVINTSLLPQIEQEIMKNYTIKDWTKFDYITIDPPTWAFAVLIIVMITTQAGYWCWATMNEYEKVDRRRMVW